MNSKTGSAELAEKISELSNLCMKAILRRLPDADQYDFRARITDSLEIIRDMALRSSPPEAGAEKIALTRLEHWRGVCGANEAANCWDDHAAARRAEAAVIHEQILALRQRREGGSQK